MADDNISREKLYDARIAQPESRFAVNVGGSAITVTPFRAVASTTSQMTFTCNVPSQTVFLDRAVELNAQVAYRFDVRCYSAQPAAPDTASQAVFCFGQDGALEALPVHSLISTLTVIINDSSVTVDLGSVMKELLRLTDYSANRKIRTAPTMLDRYVDNVESSGTVNNPLGGYENAVADDELPNGAYWDIQYANPATGNILTGTGTYTNPGAGTGLPISQNIAFIDGVPQRYFNGAPPPANLLNVSETALYAAGGYYAMAVRFRTQEFLMVSPLIFADSHEESIGIFGVNNLQVTANFKADVSRTIRCAQYYSAVPAPTALPPRGRVIGLGAGGPGITNFGTAPSLIATNPFPEAILNCTFISPSINQKLPAVSMVPWAEYPRYISNVNFTPELGPGASATGIQTQSLTIPVIPDLMVFFVKPDRQAVSNQPCINNTTGDWYLPITQIQLSFDNTAGLLSTAPASQLYRISYRNGLEMNYDEWSGFARKASTTQGGLSATTGGFLVLKPGVDFGLSAGLASGCSGNFVVQASLTIRNQSKFTVASAQVFLMCINSGFFATLAGSSRIMRNLLTEQDVVESPDAPENNAVVLRRYVGGSFLSSLGNILTKGVNVARSLAPVASAVKPLLPDSGMLGSLKSGMTAVGLGHAGGGRSGGGGSGGGGSGGAGLSRRLM